MCEKKNSMVKHLTLAGVLLYLQTATFYIGGRLCTYRLLYFILVGACVLTDCYILHWLVLVYLQTATNHCLHIFLLLKCLMHDLITVLQPTDQ